MTTYIRLNQVRKADDFTDTLSASQIQNIESTSVDDEDFLGGMLSQINKIIGATNWFDPVQDSGVQPRNLKTITDSIFYKDMLRWRVKVQDITVPAAVKATGTLTCTLDFSDTETVTLGTDVYTFMNPFVDGTPYTVKCGVSLTDSLSNLKAAINADPGGAGSQYGTGTLVNTTSEATASGATTLSARALTAGYAGNLIAATQTCASATWGVGVLTLLGGLSGNVAILSAAGFETPLETAAVGLGSANGAVVAINATFGQHALTQVNGLNYLQPKNGCLVRDANTFDPILSAGRLVTALLQAETGVVDGNTFNDTNKRVQLSFVRSNAAGTALEACPAADISGQVINYSYGSRTELNLADEQDFQFFAFSDPTSAAAITLQQAYTGGNTIDVLTTEGNLVFNLSNDMTQVQIQRGGSAFMYFQRDDTLGDSVAITSDTLTSTTTANPNFNLGVKVATAGTTINLGVTGGQIDASAITVRSSSGDLTLSAFADVKFVTTRQSALPLDDSTAGAISALPGGPYASVSAAIRSALTSAQLDIYTQTLANNYGRDANVPGATETWSPALDLSTRVIDTISPAVPDTLIFLNGVLLRGGNGTTNNDVYKGTTPANGDLKYDFTKGVKTGDMITAMSWKSG